MSETSVADAKNHLPRLIHQVERGEPIHITRHGKPVAVLIAECEYTRLITGQTPQDDFLAFLRQWRSCMADEGLGPLRMIAAIAVANDLSLVTRNSLDFSGCTGLRVENWFEE